MPSAHQPIKVLLIEDNKEHAELLGRLLGFSEHPKFSITTSASLSSGLAVLARNSPDIILLDLGLPDSDGMVTFNKANAVAPNLPIVILSGVSDVTLSIEVVQAGAQDYLVKGHVDMHLLLRSIQYAIERKRGQVATQQANVELEARVKERTAAIAAVNERLQREIAERHLTEEQLSKTNRQLTVALAELRTAQRSRAPSERTGTTTRELDEAFKRIHQHSELLLRAPALMANIEKASEHLQHIVSAADAGKKALRKSGESAESTSAESESSNSGAFEPVSLDTLIDAVITSCVPGSGEGVEGVEPKVTFEKQAKIAAEVSGDPIQLREMLAHLIRNSMSAIPRRGKVTVGTQMKLDAPILFVQDDGLGVTEAMRKRLLDPSAAVDRLDGWPSGYGVIHEVVARHSAKIEIESRKGLGTTVRVIFPPIKSPDAAGKKRVLVVDDDPLVREVISTYLGEDGYDVTLAVNGREGLEKFCAGTFDIVLTDRSMPEMEGDEFAREVKKNSPDVPVILITGFGDIMAATGEKPEGVDIVMSKPFTMAGLQSTLARFR